MFIEHHHLITLKAYDCVLDALKDGPDGGDHAVGEGRNDRDGVEDSRLVLDKNNSVFFRFTT